jgi:hypothetical protein
MKGCRKTALFSYLQEVATQFTLVSGIKSGEAAFL